jgi:monoamine oxidase
MMEFGNDFDVVVIGAGAAGVAAGKRLKAARLKALVIEARDRLGGRAWTVPTAIGKPVDLGCEWLHSADINPWAEIAEELGFALDKTPPDWASRVAIHHSEDVNDDWLATRTAFEEAYDRAALEPDDQPASALLPKNGRWNALLGAISTWANGAELELVSVKDHARYNNTQLNWRALDGYGALISAYGADLPVRFDTLVTAIDHRGRDLRIITASGEIRTKAVIITVSTNIIAEFAGKACRSGGSAIGHRQQAVPGARRVGRADRDLSSLDRLHGTRRHRQLSDPAAWLADDFVLLRRALRDRA